VKHDLDLLADAPTGDDRTRGLHVARRGSIWIGPQLELNYGFAEADRIVSMPVGGQFSVGYGKDNRVALFMGYETRQLTDGTTGEPMDSDRLAGRITFIHLW
jgi:hypothetical protein